MIKTDSNSIGWRTIVGTTPLFVYPLWYFGPVLFPFGITWFSTEASDLNIFVEQFRVLGSAQYFSNMSSQTYSRWIDHGLIRVEAIQSSIQYFFGWLMTPILGPVGTLNVYLLIGMISCGLVAYFLSRRLGTTVFIAVLTGLTVQSLPWLRQNILFGTACVFISIPLGLLVLLIKTSKQSFKISNLLRVGTYLVFLGLFYSYWFFFGLFIIAVWIASSPTDLSRLFRRLTRTQQILVALSATTAVGVAVVVFQFLLSKTTAVETGAPYGVYPVDQVLTNANTFKGLVSPDSFHLIHPASEWTEAGDEQNYLGVLVAIFSFLRLVRLARNRTLVTERRVALVSIACFILAMGRFSIFNFEIPSLREFVRFVMPGIRQFSRAGLISQSILVVLAWKEISDLATSVKRTRLRISGIVVVGAFLLLDLNPASRRFIYEPPIRYQDINSTLRKNEKSLLLVSQNSEPAFGFFDSSVLGQRDLLKLYANLEPNSNRVFSGFESEKVTHILTRVDDTGKSYLNAFVQDAVRFKLELPSRRFRPLGDDVQVQERDDFGSPIVREHLVRLVGVVPNEARRLAHWTDCLGCRKLAQYVADPPLEVVDPTANRAFNSSEWSLSNELRLQAEPLPDHRATWLQERHFMKLQLVAPEIADTNFVKVQIEDRNGRREIQISSSPTWVTIEFDDLDSANIRSGSQCLIVTSDNGKWGVLEGKAVCFGIRDFVVFTQSSPEHGGDRLSEERPSSISRY